MNRWMLYSLPLVLAAIALAAIGSRTEAVPPEPQAKAAQEPPAPPPNLLKLPTRKEAMVMKLKSSQAILEAIALNDFEKINKAATEMVLVSNVTDFINAFKGPEYQYHIQMFRRPAETIAAKAKDKNIDGVMIAYNELTLSCLKCHQAMRDNKFEVQFRPGN